MPKPEIIGYEDIAAMMKIGVSAVKMARAADASFPEPVTPPSLRTPGFDRAQIEEYIRNRAKRTPQADRPAAPERKPTQTPEIVGYEEIAAMMKVGVSAVRKARATDNSFPEPVTPPFMRSPGFDRTQIKEYIRARAKRSPGQSGRPVATGDLRYKLTSDTNESINTRIREAGTFTEFAALINLSDNGLRQRLAGKTSWRDAELRAIASRLSTTLSELTRGER